MLAAKEALGLSRNYVDLWAEFMKPLAETEVSDDTWDRLINEAFGPAEDATDNAKTRWEKTYEDLNDIWYGETILGTPYQNTQFAVWNALNEEHGWSLKGRGDNATENAAAARSGFSPVWNAKNQELLALAQTA
jgi:hypothetical protein